MKPPRISFVLVALLLAAVPLAADTTVDGRTGGGAYYRIVKPDEWNGDLVIWNHGFSLSPPAPLGDFDLGPLVDIQLIEGYAVAASSYRQAGWALFKTNQDLRALVGAFSGHFGPPERIILSGGSLGGIVTAFAIEKGNLGPVVGALTLCGAMAGSRNWDGALDLRLLYDAICSEVEGAAIPGGPQGLPKGSDFSSADLQDAAEACFGIGLAKSRRSSAQKRRLKQFLRATGLPEEFVLTDLGYVTFAMSDLVHDRQKLRGRLGTGNVGVDYDDPTLNAIIERVEPHRKGERKLGKFFRPQGRVGGVKIINLHTDKDGLVIVENQSEYASVVPPGNLTIGVAVEKRPTHCGFTPAEVLGPWEALREWIDGAPQPTPRGLLEACEAWEGFIGGPCRFDPGFEIPDMDGRIRPR